MSSLGASYEGILIQIVEIDISLISIASIPFPRIRN